MKTMPILTEPFAKQKPISAARWLWCNTRANWAPAFHEIIDVLRMTMYKFKDTGGKPEKLPIPDDERERADELHKELIEAVASNDETLMEKYFDKGELDEDEMKEAG